MPGASFAVEVQPYDHEHKRKLLSLDDGLAIQGILNQRVLIPKPDFIAYLAFHDRRNRAGWDTRASLRKKGKALWEYFGDDLEATANSLRAKVTGNEAVRGFAESLGQAIGLGVLDHAFGLTEADWNRIPIGPDKDLDFWIASNHNRIIELETKGSAVSDNNFRGNLSACVADIRAKKEAAGRHSSPGDRPIRLGTIGVIDSRPDSTLKCWLVDPPPIAPLADPPRLQIIKRLGFVLNQIIAISPMSPIAVALSNRILAIWNSDDWRSLSGISLFGWRGKPMKTNPSRTEPERLSWFDSRAAVEEMNAGGIVMGIGNGKFFLFGIVGELLNIVVSQQLDDLSKFKIDPEIKKRSVIWSTTAHRASSLGLSYDASPKLSVKVRLEGNVFVTSAGRVFGILRPTKSPVAESGS